MFGLCFLVWVLSVLDWIIFYFFIIESPVMLKNTTFISAWLILVLVCLCLQ